MPHGEKTCRGTRDDGEPCGVPERFLDENGLCPAHRPGGREKVREAARRGGEASARRRASPGLDTKGEKYRLETYADAKKWLEILLRAVVGGAITDKQARAGIRAVEAWMTAYEKGDMDEKMDELRDALAKWRDTGDVTPVLEVVEGGRS